MIEQVVCHKYFGSSTNFVDDLNRFVGFDDGQQCCEAFGWRFYNFKDDAEADAFDNSGNNYEDSDVDNYMSIPEPRLDDANFAKEQPLAGSGKFKIEGSPDCNYLVLYNYHNGYYYHGFIMKDGDKEICSGAL